MRKHFLMISKGIRFKLIAATLALFLLFASINTYAWYSNLTREATNTSVNNIQSMMEISNENFETALKDINNIVILISSDLGNHLNSGVFNYLLSDNVKNDIELLQYRRDAEDYITSLCNFKSYLNGLAVYDLKGNSLTYGPTMSWADVKKQTWYQQLLSSKNQEIFIPPHYYSEYRKQDGDSVFSIAHPIIHDGETIGYVIADIKTSMLKNMFDIRNVNGYSLFVIDDQSDRVIFAPVGNSSLYKTTDLDFKKLTAQFNTKTNHFFTQLSSIESLVVYQRSNFTPWTIVGFVPKSVVLSSFSAASNQVMMIAALCGGICIFLIFLFASALTKNLRLLTKSVSQIDKNNFDFAVNIKSEDEIGRLYQQIKFMIERIQELIAGIKKTEKEKRKSEIQALQAQINPHFLYNTLNTIKFLSVMQGVNNIKDVSESLSNMLHINLDKRKFISISEETDYLKDYLRIQEYRYSDKFKSIFLVDEDVKNKWIPKLLLQPLLENAIRHGIVPMIGQGIIQIRIFAETGELKISVKDNGVGMNNDKTEEIIHAPSDSTHIGIANIQSRIKMIFGDHYGLSILSEENLYTAVEICLPLISEEEVDLYD